MIVAEMIIVHMVPLWNSLFLLLITDVVFLKKDAMINFWAGIAYIITNGIGSIYYGKPVYQVPFIDWKDPLVTLFFGAL